MQTTRLQRKLRSSPDCRLLQLDPFRVSIDPRGQLSCPESMRVISNISPGLHYNLDSIGCNLHSIHWQRHYIVRLAACCAKKCNYLDFRNLLRQSLGKIATSEHEIEQDEDWHYSNLEKRPIRVIPLLVSRIIESNLNDLSQALKPGA